MLIYAESAQDLRRREIAVTILQRARDTETLLPLQAAGEGVRWLIRKGGLSKPQAIVRAREWLMFLTPVETDLDVFEEAGALIESHDFQVWDAIILSATASAGASVLLSEDLQDGFRWRGVTVLNPFADEPSPLIAKIMNG